MKWLRLAAVGALGAVPFATPSQALPLASPATAVSGSSDIVQVRSWRRGPNYWPGPTPRISPNPYAAYNYAGPRPIEPFAGGPASHKMGPIGPMRTYRIWTGPDGRLYGE